MKREDFPTHLVDFGSTLWPRWTAHCRSTLRSEQSEIGNMREQTMQSGQGFISYCITTWAGETSNVRAMELTTELRIRMLREELPREL